MGRLTVANVRALKDPGRYADGQCLYLYITPTGTKSWIARVQRDGKQRDIGLGAADLVTLAEAREKCRTVRLQVKAGLDPVYERNKTRGIPSFCEAAVDFIDRNKQTWKNEKHRAQWLATLESYAFPKIGNMSVDQITSPIVRDLLLDIWLEIPETARWVRQRTGPSSTGLSKRGIVKHRCCCPALARAFPSRAVRRIIMPLCL